MHAAALGRDRVALTQGSLRAHNSAGAMLMQNAKNQTAAACEAENQSPALLQYNAIISNERMYVYEENYSVHCSQPIAFDCK
jgi:hypothetical protein